MSNGSISESWRLCTASAWSAFHANVRCRFWRRLGLTRRLALLDRVVKPILLFRLQPFVPTVHWAGQLRKLQRHMVSRALGNYRLPCEALRDYWKRVSRIVRQHLGVSVSDWAQAWISSAVSWDDHAQRDFEEQERYFSSSDFEAFRRRCSMFCRIHVRFGLCFTSLVATSQCGASCVLFLLVDEHGSLIGCLHGCWS